MDKTGLRKKYKALRLGMNESDVRDKSDFICKKIFGNVDWRQIKSLHTYRPVGKLNEVDITELLVRVRAKYPDVDISTTGSSKDEAIPSQKFDLIIVPALAFDEHNYRLGWGGGWYDRFLADQAEALKIGLCFQNGFVKEGLPREPHDVRLDKVITEV